MLILLLLLSFDELLAVVENRCVTEQELIYLSRLYPTMGDEELLEKMIMGRVILNVAREETLLVSDEDVNNEKIRLLQVMPALKVILSHPYIDSLYNEELRIQLYMKKLIQSKFQGRINISPKSVRNFYETHMDSFTYPSTVTLERLDIPVIPKDENRLLKLAGNIISEYRSGADFATLAKIYSDDPATKYIGGKLGVIKPEDVPPYLAGVLQIPEGEVDLFESPRGYHIVHLKKSDIREVELEHIFLEFIFKEEEISNALKRADDVKKRWESGDSTLNASIVPMGIVPVKALGYPLSTVIDTLDEGEISSPILDGGSFHLLRIAQKTEQKIPPFSEVKENVRNLLYQRMVNEAFLNWYEDIKKRVYLKRL